MKLLLLALFFLTLLLACEAFAEVGVAPMGEKIFIARQANTIDQDEEVVVRVILGEARGESLAGQQAVANVIHNRSLKQKKSFSEVCVSPSQFHAYVPPLTSVPPELLFQVRWLAQKMMANELFDITNGATHFHSGSQPWWAKSMVETVKMGGHRFYKERVPHPRF